MMKSEFEEMLHFEVSAEDYKIIEHCYMEMDNFFPDKKSVVYFYRTHGIDGFKALYKDLSKIEGKRREYMKKDIHYRTKSLKDLIDGYAFEVGRENMQDRKATQKAIVLEVYARIKNTFDMLDSDPKSVDQIYKQLIKH